MYKIIFKVCLPLAVALLTGCGGGGGSAGTNPNAPQSSLAGATSTSTVSGSSTSTVTAVVGTPTMSVLVANTAGAAVSGIAFGGGYVARATVKDAKGAPVASKLVTYSVSGVSVAILTPGTALTNDQGIAEVAIAPSSISSVGAATITAKANVAGVDITSGIDFSVQPASVTLGSVTVGNGNLASAGNTSVGVAAMIGGVAAINTPINVTFSASCGRINNQNTSTGGVGVTTNGSGVAAAVYDAVALDGTLCSGPVNITASSAGAASQIAKVNVATPTASAVVFVSANPGQIFVAGTGALDRAIVKFNVLSSSGAPLPNVPVNLSIVTNPGGVSLGTLGSIVPVTVSTLANGEVSTSVFSGTIPGAVKVRAELAANAGVFSESQNLTVASGPPSQDHMSLSVDTFNIEGAEYDGKSALLTVRVADRQGNAVNDGTVINFTAEGGQIASSCTTLQKDKISQCSVAFVTQNPRPRNGRVSVLAYAPGTKSYIDKNGNNRYDSTDMLLNQGLAYRDDNENGVYDADLGEFLLPASAPVLPPTLCPGSGAPYPSVKDTCDTGLQTTVRQQAVILLSSSHAGFAILSASPAGVAVKVRSLGNPLLPMPAGTSVAAVAIDANSGDGQICSVTGVTPSIVDNVPPAFNPNADLSTTHSISLKGCNAGDSVLITVIAPSSLISTFSIPL